MKPFVAAELLDRKLARPDEAIETYNGLMERDGRKIRDEHGAARMTLSEVIQKSSNVGIVRFSDRLNARSKYEMLRDLGFGAPTGILLPAESHGTLREPKLWSRQSTASLMMGYEVSVTALQLASAYAAIANGGELLEPQLVKEIRDPDGKVVHKAERRVVRRVMSDSVARTMQHMLVGVVEHGTATKAAVGLYDLGGKTGTARRAGGGGYKAGSYTASFVGLFPGDDPQLVVLVKLDDPTKTIFGGEAAAPVTKVVLNAALAAGSAALDPNKLLASAHPDTALPVHIESEEPGTGKGAVQPGGAASPGGGESPNGSQAPGSEDTMPEGSGGAASYVVSLPARREPAPAVRTPRPVPNVAGLSLRKSVHALHGAGFRVRIAGDLAAETTSPAAGTLAPPGTIVRLGSSR
jgi:cell division protein FtsI (penicillin-binding protein 3)